MPACSPSGRLLVVAMLIVLTTAPAIAQSPPPAEDIFKDGFDPPGPAPINDTCQTATTLFLSNPSAGTTLYANNNYDSGLEACTGYAQGGSDVAYAITLLSGQAVTVSLGSPYAAFDPSISLLGPGAANICDAAPITTCVAGADNFGFGQGESFSYVPSVSGTYYIIVDSLYPGAGSSGGFTIQVTSP